jgi:hypothetical protein
MTQAQTKKRIIEFIYAFPNRSCLEVAPFSNNFGKVSNFLIRVFSTITTFGVHDRGGLAACRPASAVSLGLPETV